MADADVVLGALANQLASDDTQQATAAAWDVLSLGERLADTLTWQEDTDAVQAMAASQACREARRYLPAPVAGRPPQTIPTDTSAVADFARLLALLADLLQSDTESRIQATSTARRTAAVHTTAAHQALSALSRKSA
ncbi:hypothetical protein [Streptomyces sp. NPDC001165]|uniref:hypothetical protein n=1 Tax=Streptomyces sp. NPDC001165 TaxID=3364546 RepID=UPI00369260CD